MGYAISWLAVKDRDPESVRKELGLSLSGKFGIYPEHPFVGRMLPSEWYLLVADRCDHRMISDRVLTALSAGCTVVACSIEEHVMYCSSNLWSDGKESWRVQHQGDRNIMDLRESGLLPPEFDQIRANCLAEQVADGGDKANVDHVFDIPLQLAKHFVGFRHDETTPGIESDSFEVLVFDQEAESALAKKKRWGFW